MKVAGEDTDWAWLLKTLRPFLRPYIWGAVLAVCGGLSTVIDPLAMKALVDVALPAKRTDWAILAVFLFILGSVSRMLIGAASSLILFRASQKAALKLRVVLLRHITALSLDFHSTVAPGDTLFRIEKDVEQVIDGTSSVLTQVLMFVSSWFISGSVMLYLNPRLTIALIPLAGLLFAVRQLFKGRLQGASERVQHAAGGASALVQEHIGVVPQIQLLRCERIQMLTLTTALASRIRADATRKINEIAFSSISFGIMIISTGVILGVGSLQVSRGNMTVGDLLASYTLLGRLFDPIGAAAGLYSQFSRIGVSIRRIRGVLDIRPSVSELSKANANPTSPAILHLRGVSFEYHHHCRLLKELELRITAGERVGITGTSGSGKTTLARIMARILDPTGGRVLLNGLDLRAYRLRSLRSSIVYIHQEPVLLNRTIRENLLLADSTASVAHLWDALRLVSLDEKVRTLGSQLDTPVGPLGARFSGGERQRLILARALLMNPSILILDEATSAIDEATERLILRGIHSTFPLQTLILISHRFTSLRLMDRVLELCDGTIKFDGPPTLSSLSQVDITSVAAGSLA